MPTFAQLAQQARRHVVLGPSAFKETYRFRPRADVAIGLIVPSEHDTIKAHGEAAKSLADLVDGRPKLDVQARTKHFEEVFMTWAVALCTCDPNDVKKPYFEAADDVVPIALTPEAIRHIYDEIEILALEVSPIRASITDEELPALATFLATGGLSRLSRAKGVRVRKLLRFCLDELAATIPA